MSARHQGLGGAPLGSDSPLFGGQGLGLLIADLLQDVFDPAQEAIGIQQAVAMG